MRRYAGGTGRTAQGTTFELLEGGDGGWQTYLESWGFFLIGQSC